jgi:secreted PhoX family phosphatase
MKTNYSALILLVILSLAGCGKKVKENPGNSFIFNPVDTAFGGKDLLVPSGNYKAVSLYTEGDLEKVEWKGIMAPAKGKHHLIVFLPIDGSPTHGILWVNHESISADAQIGNGGGASVMEVYRDSLEGWKLVGFPYAVDFGPVGGTLHNCLGVLTPWGTILSSEEIEPANNYVRNPNDSTQKLLLDSASFGGRPRWMNYGWMVEVDPLKREVLGKRHAMGRFMHEGIAALDDQKTFYMCDDEAPGAFFKFVADTAKNLNSGQLYAWRMDADSNGRHWMTIPRGRDTLLHARRHAFQRGASIFTRLEDIEVLPDGSFLITETGKDSVSLASAIAMGGKVMPHLEKYHVGKQIYDDRHGRILRYDPKTETMTVFLEGGQALEDRSIVLSNPDNLAYNPVRNLLVIQEDLNGISGGRVPNKPNAVKICEIYVLDLNNPKPILDHLKRFAVIPAGCESTGACWSPDYSSLFFNIQNEGDKKNPAKPPYDKSQTVVVTGFPK